MALHLASPSDAPSASTRPGSAAGSVSPPAIARNCALRTLSTASRALLLLARRGWRRLAPPAAVATGARCRAGATAARGRLRGPGAGRGLLALGGLPVADRATNGLGLG